MSFPLHGIWCINRDNDNKFQAYKSQGTRIFIICSWNRQLEDSMKFVVALISAKGKILYFDSNDLPLYPKERITEFENSIGQEATTILHNMITENKKHNIMKTNRNKVRLTESQLHRVIKESVRKVLREDIRDTDPIEDEEYWSGHGYDDDPRDMPQINSIQMSNDDRINAKNLIQTFSNFQDALSKATDYPTNKSEFAEKAREIERTLNKSGLHTMITDIKRALL